MDVFNKWMKWKSIIHVWLTRIGRKHRYSRPAAKRLCWIYGTQKMDDKWMSSTDWHQTVVQTWRANNRPERICDLIHRCNSPAKCCDDHALQCIVCKFCNEKPAAEYIVDISGIHCSFLTSWNRTDPNHCPNSLSYPRPHFRPPLQHPLAALFDPYHECYRYHRFLVPRNYQLLFAVSTIWIKKIWKQIVGNKQMYGKWLIIQYKYNFDK